MKPCIKNLWLSKSLFLVLFFYFYCCNFLLFSDLGTYQQPARESLSTEQDVAMANMGKRKNYQYLYYCSKICCTMCILYESNFCLMGVFYHHQTRKIYGNILMYHFESFLLLGTDK